MMIMKQTILKCLNESGLAENAGDVVEMQGKSRRRNVGFEFENYQRAQKKKIKKK